MKPLFHKLGPWALAIPALAMLATGILLAIGPDKGAEASVDERDAQPQVIKQRSGIGAMLPPPAQAQMAYLPFKVGEKVPDIDVPKMDSGRIKLGDYSGKVVMLDFWSVTCGPCLEASAHMQRMYLKYGDKGFVVLGINLDPYPQMAKVFRDRARLTYPIGFATDKVIRDYGGLRSIPQSFMVDQKGVLFRHYEGWGAPYVVQIENDIKQLLKL